MPSSVSSQPFAPVPIHKRFIQVGPHCIHYRVTGAGPAVVLLHDSPRSSRLHLDTMRRLGTRFRVFALDTPGYGNSTPIGLAQPRIADFARVLGETLDALGLARAPLYATHTSAKIALEHAAHANVPPAVLLLDGLAIPQQAPDEAFIAAYMRPFRIDPDGAWLAAEWSRTQDMLRWFPWFDPAPAHRIAMDRPDDAWIADYVIDLLSAGPHYSDAYAAAMRYDPRGALCRVACPTVIGARSDDVLYGALDLLPADRSASIAVARLSPDREAWLAWIAATLGEGATAIAEPPAALATHGPAYVDLPHGQIRIERDGPGDTPTLLILETPIPLHARFWQAELAGQRATLVPDLPGSGESDPLPAGASLDDHADVLAALLEALGIEACDVLAIGHAAPLAMALATRHALRITTLAFDGVGPAIDAAAAARLCPAIVADHGGGHLHRIWHMLRAGEVQWPWHDGRVAAQRGLAPNLAAGPLYRALLDILKQPDHYGDVVDATAGWVPETAPVPSHPALFFALPGDPGYAAAAPLAARFAQARVIARPVEIAAAARSLAEALLPSPLHLGPEALS